MTKTIAVATQTGSTTVPSPLFLEHPTNKLLAAMNKDASHRNAIRPCPVCCNTPDLIEASRPLGRIVDIYRVKCTCGNGELSSWSPTETSAVRLWNKHNAQAIEDDFPHKG